MTATAEPTTVVKTVIDCADVAWGEHGATGLGGFAALYRDDLDAAGCELIRPLLVETWRRRGYRVRLVNRTDFYAAPDSIDDPANELFWAARQEAAEQIDFEALLTATDLHDEYRTYES